MKIAILVPMLSGAKAQFAVSLANMVSHTVLETRAEVTTHTVTHSALEVARNALLDKALRRGADYALWLDADHVFPSDALLRLLAHKKEAVALNQPRRQKDIVPTAVRGGQLVGTTHEMDGLEEVDSVGLAFFLLDMRVMAKLQEHAYDGDLWPLFKQEWPSADVYVEGDRHFCRRLGSAGVPIYIDHALSLEVGHIAETVLRFT